MNHQTVLKEFRKFAEEKFVNHKEELDTTYQIIKGDTNDRRHAYLNHRQILEMELIDRIDEVLTNDTASLGPSLNDTKNYFISKLKSD